MRKIHISVRAALLLMLLMLPGCDDQIVAPDGATALDPPAVYESWWTEVEADAQILRRRDVKWMLVPGRFFYRENDPQPVLGLWATNGTIFLAETATLHEGVVKHEMLHEVLRGDYEHRNPLFEKYSRIPGPEICYYPLLRCGPTTLSW